LAGLDFAGLVEPVPDEPESDEDEDDEPESLELAAGTEEDEPLRESVR
jgi:hypothetical protein